MIVYENVQELKVEADMSVIPSFSLSFVESSLYVAEAVEKDFNEMFKSIGVNELTIYESTGVAIVYEGTNLETLKNTVIDFLKKTWQKIKGLFENMLRKFEEWKKQAVKDLGKITDSALDNIDPDKTFGKVHKFNLKDIPDFGANATDVVNDAIVKFDNDPENATDIKAEIEKTIISKVSGEEAENLIDMKKKLTEKYAGEVVTADLEFVKKHLQDMKDIVINGNTKNDIKKQYVTTKKFIDGRISEVKKMKTGEQSKDKWIAAEISILKDALNCMNSANTCIADIAKRRFVEYRNILVHVKKAAGLKFGKEDSTTETVKNESVIASQIDLIEGAFNW